MGTGFHSCETVSGSGGGAVRLEVVVRFPRPGQETTDSRTSCGKRSQLLLLVK